RLSGWVAANRQIIINSDPTLDLGHSSQTIVNRPRSALSLPLMHEGQLIGVLSFYSSDPDSYTDRHRRIATVISRVIAQELALKPRGNDSDMTNDPVTGLPTEFQLHRLIETIRTDYAPVQGSLGLLRVAIPVLSIGNRVGETDRAVIHVGNLIRQCLRR